ncbi:MAG: hypothetical protein FJZ01_03395 [Candidatus Sericytochromatia bacterium]|nr:hypothetical protein [Candidatus Tanganyikabacteria bacterium]
MVRQGDILLVPQDELPEGATELPIAAAEALILAAGEATGHAHTVATAGNRYWQFGRARYLEIGVASEVTHQEHAPVAFATGLYRVVRQRSYQPADEADLD